MKNLLSFFIFSLLLICQTNAQDFFNSIEEKFSQYKNSAPKERVQIITDRDIYSTGELMWVNVTILDIHTPCISELSNQVKIVLRNHESIDLFEKTLEVEMGNGNGFINIPDGLNEGVYYLAGFTNQSDPGKYSFIKKIVVKEKILPQFLIRSSFQEKGFIPGDQFDMTLEFSDFYNEPERNIEYAIDFYDGEKKFPGAMGKTKKTGLATVNVKVPSKLKSGIFSYKISAEGKGTNAYLEGKFPVLTDHIYIDFYPENGKLVDAIESRVSFFAYDAAGSPMAIEADLLEDGKTIQTLVSALDGTGSFKLTPNIEEEYQVKIKRPLLLEKSYELPAIVTKGIALKEVSKSTEKVRYMLENGYQSTRLVYLVGVSDGEIFWTSEHEIDRTFQVDIDLTKATGRIAHFIAINAAKRIEGEHVMLIPGKDSEPLEMKQIKTSTSIRGENIYEIDMNKSNEGRLIFSAVNSGWISDQLTNKKIQNPMPFDIGLQQVFQSGEFGKNGFSDEELEKYIDYYVPYAFGWDRVLNTKGAFELNKMHEAVLDNSLFLEQQKGRQLMQKSEGKILHMNLSTEQIFATSNPKYFNSLYTEKRERIPAYKKMLADGTSVLDVLQTIKPYELQGNNIVFMGSANSFNFQGGALIAIDGFNRGTDASVLKTLSPFDVETMSASTNPNDIQRYTGLNSVGVVEITLKKGKLVQQDNVDIPEDTQFTAPEYKNENDTKGNDFRSTLWWEVVDVNADKSNTSFTFYNSELFSNVRGVVYFIPIKGVPTSSTFEYEIK